MNKNVLFVSYDGALDPLGYSQIIPYLLGLSQNNIKFTLLTYEKRQNLNDITKINMLQDRLEKKNIKWEILKYHQSPSLPATAFDIIMGLIKGFIIVIRDRIDFIHARSFVGAIPALVLIKLFNLRFLFDMRGFWADERVDGNIWQNKGLLYKVAKWWEKKFLLNADWTVCLTETAKTISREFPYLKKRNIFIDIIPTCVDTVKFTIRTKNEDLLERFNLRNRFIFIYFGSIGTWYMLDEMIDFFKVAKQINSNSFFLLLSPDKTAVLKNIIQKEVKQDDYFADYVSYEEMPLWISIADVSLSFIKPTYSKKSSCPVKLGESLACGLPVVINSGIGDCDEIVRKNRIGTIIDSFSVDGYNNAVSELKKLLQDKKELNQRCRRVAEDLFSLDKGVEKYLRVYHQLKMKG